MVLGRISCGIQQFLRETGKVNNLWTREKQKPFLTGPTGSDTNLDT